jgi:hypothetical protein
MQPSSFLSVNAIDILKGMALAIGTAVFAIVAPSIQKGVFIFDWTAIWHTAVAAGITYIGAKFFTGKSTQS